MSMVGQPEHAEGELLSIRYNQILGLFDRSPLATAICHAEGPALRVVNPAFAIAVGVPRNELRGAAIFDVLSPVRSGELDALREALRRMTNARHELDVTWASGAERRYGRVTFELVDDALIGNVPLLTYLHVDRAAPGDDAVPVLEPIALAILELVAAGETTAAVARAVGLTVDGVNYHVGRTGRRLGATNRTAVVARAYVLGVLDPNAWPPRAALRPDGGTLT